MVKALIVVTAMSLVASGCSGQGEVRKKGSTVVIAEDVKSESALADGSLIVERQTDIKIETEINNLPYKQPVTADVITYNENGKLFSLDLAKGTTQKVAEHEALTVSENGLWALSFENEEGELYLHDLVNKKMKVLKNAAPVENRFLDNEVFYRYFTTEKIVQVNPETNDSKTWDMSEFEKYSLDYMEKQNGITYIAAESKKDGYGIYQLLENEKVKHVLSVPKASDISDFSMLADDSIIFQGTVEEKDGVFHWDKQDDNVQKIISAGEDQEGKWISFYKLSPDKSKILYDMPVQVGGLYKSNVYMAELVDGELVNSTRIMENADLYSTISFSSGWNNDSKTVYIKTISSTEEYVGDIAIFRVKE
jgi:hypothetical protein